MSERKRTRAAVELGRLRWAGLTEQDRKLFARFGVEARKTKRDRRIEAYLERNREWMVIDVVDTLFRRLAKERRPLAVVLHQGVAQVVDPEGKDHRVFAQRHPEAIVGTYDCNASRAQVFDDIKQMQQPLVNVG